MNIDKDIHMLKSYAGMTHKLTDNQGRPKLDQAIENVLSEFLGLREFSTETVRRNAELQEELDIYKKIVEFLADKGNFDHDRYCESNIFSCNAETPKKTCKQCIIDWAKREVLKDE